MCGKNLISVVESLGLMVEKEPMGYELFSEEWVDEKYFCKNCILTIVPKCNIHNIIACDCDSSQAFLALSGFYKKIMEGYLVPVEGSAYAKHITCDVCEGNIYKIWAKDDPGFLARSKAAKRGWQTRRKNKGRKNARR